MTDNNLKHRTGPTMKVAPETLPLDGGPPVPPKQSQAAPSFDPWKPMDSAPRDGRFLYLRGDQREEVNEIANEWYWYNTRQFRKGVFQPVGWWRRRFGPNCPPSFTPTGWRLVSEGFPA